VIEMELHALTATEMLQRLAAGDISSEQLVRDHHARADAVEGQVRAFTEQYREASLARARAVDEARARGEDVGPLGGLPISVKENLALVGTPATVGIKARLADRATWTCPAIRAAQDAGAIVLGKTNVPQLLLAMESHNDVFGTTHNPWDVSRAPGGSSGGEAAAIAAGMSAAGLGTDIGGSIRNPAAWCGIVGLKPTWGRWSTYGSAGGQPGQEAVKAQLGPMARTVDDVTLLMRALTPRFHALDPLVPPVPFTPLEEIDLRGMVVGVYEDDGVFAPSAAVRRAVREAAAAAAAAGATVVAYQPPRSWEMVETYFSLMSADGTATARAMVGAEPVTPQLRTVVRLARVPGALRGVVASLMDSRGERRVATILRSLGAKPVQRVWQLVVLREALKRAELEAWAAIGAQVVLGPPTVTPAAHLGETHDWSLGAWHTMRWNLLDQPAGVVPVTTVRADEQTRAEAVDRLDAKAAKFDAGSAGLPVGVQVIGRPWEEDRVLAVMRAIEAGVRGSAGFPVTPVTPVTRG
jgi:fatty acid amide hydrolase